MNLRRINANERFKMFGSLLTIILLVSVLIVVDVKVISDLFKPQDMSEYTCEQIENITTMSQKEYMKNFAFASDQVIVYYLKNCVNQTRQQNG